MLGRTTIRNNYITDLNILAYRVLFLFKVFLIFCGQKKIPYQLLEKHFLENTINKKY